MESHGRTLVSVGLKAVIPIAMGAPKGWLGQYREEPALIRAGFPHCMKRQHQSFSVSGKPALLRRLGKDLYWYHAEYSGWVLVVAASFVSCGNNPFMSRVRCLALCIE